MKALTTFGTMPDGEAVPEASISGGGLAARVIAYGAVLHELRLSGHRPPLVLGLNTLEDYLAHSRYFGATVGRCANRIRDARFVLDGKTHTLDRNFRERHHLHGGSAGIGKRVWTFEDVRPDRVVLSITLDDGEMGYPGAMRVRQTMSLPGDGVFDIRIEAEADAPTLCNIAHHSYFNLDGADTILDHELQVAADRYIPVDTDLIPTGEIASLDGHMFDFRSSKPLRPVCEAALLDNNFCLADGRRALAHAATLRAPATGIAMQVLTTEPGLQIYDGANIDVTVPGLDGRAFHPHAGIALEPQVWPDAINHPAFPQAVLRPGEVYRQQTRYVFTRESAP